MSNFDRTVQALEVRLAELEWSRAREQRARRRARFAAAFGLTIAAVATAAAQPGVSSLHVFAADTPARASQVNQNFSLLQTWITNKVGTANVGWVNNKFRIDEAGGTYDVWIQGGAATSGTGRNLAMLGFDEDSGDYLVINYGGEYANGVRIQSNLAVNGTLNVSSGATFSTLTTNQLTATTIDVNTINAVTVNGRLGSGASAGNIIDRVGPLPLQQNFSTEGGTVIFFISGSAFRGDPGSIYMEILIDTVSRGRVGVFTNAASDHRAMVAKPLVLTGLSAGSHTIRLEAGAGSGTMTDFNDIFHVSFIELPL